MIRELNKKMTCVDNSGYELTLGKEYLILNIQDGIFESRPFVGFLDDSGKMSFSHAHRLTEDLERIQKIKKLVGRK